MKKKNRRSKNLANFLLLSLALSLSSCAVQIPNTKFCAVAGLEEAGMDCFQTLSNDAEWIPPEKIKDFLEARPDHGAAICQPMEDWGKEHEALELACQKLGAACTYDIKQMIDEVTTKVNNLETK